MGRRNARPALISDAGGHYAAVGDFAILRGSWKFIVTAPREQTSEPQRRYLFDMKKKGK